MENSRNSRRGCRRSAESFCVLRVLKKGLGGCLVLCVCRSNERKSDFARPPNLCDDVNTRFVCGIARLNTSAFQLNFKSKPTVHPRLNRKFAM